MSMCKNNCDFWISEFCQNQWSTDPCIQEFRCFRKTCQNQQFDPGCWQVSEDLNTTILDSHLILFTFLWQHISQEQFQVQAAWRTEHLSLPLLLSTCCHHAFLCVCLSPNTSQVLHITSCSVTCLRPVPAFTQAKLTARMTQVKTLNQLMFINLSSSLLKRMLCLSFGHILAFHWRRHWTKRRQM